MSLNTQNTKIATRAYESVIIVDPDTSLEAQKELFQRNKKIVEDHNGKMNHVDTWGRRLLGNPIEKTTRGIFFHSTFYADNKAVAELERTMRINDHVLRFQHTRLEDGTDLVAFVEQFKKDLAANAVREKEREAKQARRFSARREGGGRSEDGDEGMDPGVDDDNV